MCYLLFIVLNKGLWFSCQQNISMTTFLLILYLFIATPQLTVAQVIHELFYKFSWIIGSAGMLSLYRQVWLFMQGHFGKIARLIYFVILSLFFCLVTFRALVSSYICWFMHFFVVSRDLHFSVCLKQIIEFCPPLLKKCQFFRQSFLKNEPV